MKQKCQCPERASEREEGKRGGGAGRFLKLLLFVRLEVGGMACRMGTEFIDVT